MRNTGLRPTPIALAAAVACAVSGCQSLDRLMAPKYNPPSSPVRISRANDGRAPAVAAPEPASAAVLRAQEFESQGQYEQALAEFERAIETNPRMTVAYLGAGDIYRQQGDYESAEERYAMAARIEPRNFDAQYLHGLALQMLDRLADAVKAYIRALTIRPDDFNANLNLGTAYLQLGEPQQALPYAERAVRLDGKDGAARTNLGAIYAALGRHEDAVVEFQQAAELTELSAPLLLNLADSYGRVGRHEEMVNTLEQLVRTEPTAVAYERLGAGLFRLRRYDESLSGFRKSLEIDPNHYPALNGVGVSLLNQWVWSQQKDTAAREEALRSLRRSLQIERDQPKILELIGRYQ
jgi:tetratricopeptide (TPR) repeat protein